ncbi:MAG: hypothetical protein LBH09_06925 [Peptococcaceae bacterium]|nr:hypothetical protein [Peptococcaceae bacterium]
MPGNGRKEPDVEENKLLNCLKRRHYGWSKAVKSPVLEARFGISGRVLREMINELRCQGHPVCSDENGYYYASTEAELLATIRQLNSRISKIAKAKNGLVRTAKKCKDDGQLRLPL